MSAVDTLAQRFVLERELGRGGMGVVFRATDSWDGTPCAVKIVEAGGATRRFLREAQILAQLAHPTIVRYRGHGLTSAGAVFLAMEWVEGPDLERYRGTRALTIGDTLRVGRRIAEALTVVHAAGIVHRDLKPSNVFLPEGRPDQAKLGDFGIAHLSKELHATSTLTRKGAVIGTPGYLAPEQLHSEEIDPRTDMFGLGCVLFECATGKPAFAAESMLASLAKIALEETPRLREVRPDAPPELDALVVRLLQKKKEDRPASIAEVHAILCAIDDQRPSIAPPAPGASVGTGERRLVPIVVCPGDDTVVPFETFLALRRDLTELGQRAGARTEVLPDGSVIAIIDVDAESPREETLRAARLAIALRSHLGDRAIALATARVTLAQGLPVSEIATRALDMVKAAPPSAIVLDEGTASFLDARFEINREGETTLLGAERTEETAKRRLLGKATPFVGRRRELSLLLTTLEECVDESYARSVLVTGHAGLGKSRLLSELSAEAKQRYGRAVRIVTGRGDPVRAGVPYSLLGDAIRRDAAISGDDDSDAKLAKMRSMVARDGEAREDLVAFLGEIANLELPASLDVRLAAARRDPPMMNALTREAFVEWARRASTGRTLLLALDDLHWGDGASVQLVDAALGALSDAPLCVLVLGRPEVRQTYPRLFDARDITELKLGRLSKRASEDLVHAVLGEVDESLTDLIVERAEGNAFFLEELIRAGAHGHAALPDTVLGVMEARLEELEPEARRILRAASVFGESSWATAVRSVLGTEAVGIDVTGWLESLAAQEVLVPQHASRFAAEREYQFRHALLRDASYAMLLDEDRKVAHARAASWLEQKGERAAAVLAAHWERAEENERAVDAYVRAVEQSLRGNDLAAAVSLGEHAERCGADGIALGTLRLLEAEAFTWMGEPERAKHAALEAAEKLPVRSAEWHEAVAHLIEASALLGQSDDVARWVEALREAQGAIVDAGARPVPTTREDVDLAEAIERSPAALRERRAAALSRASFALVLLGRTHEAELLLEEPDRAESDGQLREPITLAHLAHARAARAMIERKRERAAKHYEAAADAFEASGSLRLASGARTNVAAMYLELGAAELALDALDRAMGLAEKTGARYSLALARVNRGIALSRLGRANEAVAELGEAASDLERQGDRRLAASARCAAADALLEAGQLEAAEVEAKRALEAAEGLPPARAAALATLAAIQLRLGRTRDATETATLGERARTTTTMEEREVLLDLVHAEIAKARGDEEGARQLIAKIADALVAQAREIESNELRQAFLERVPENKRAIELRAAWNAPS